MGSVSLSMCMYVYVYVPSKLPPPLDECRVLTHEDCGGGVHAVAGGHEVRPGLEGVE